MALIRLLTRHAVDFDIFTDVIDPTLSVYAATNPDYVQKVTDFYSELRIASAVWTVPESTPIDCFQEYKPIEYLLEVDENRIVAYVDEESWSQYFKNQSIDFTYSRSPGKLGNVSILVEAPLRQDEVKERRTLRRKNHRGECEIIHIEKHDS